MVTINCPRCQKTFTHKYPSKAQEKLQSHLARKNPCNSPEYKIERQVTTIIPNLEDVDITGVVECLDSNIRYRYVASKIFGHVLAQNNFAVWPNTKLEEVWFKENDEVMVSPPGYFLLRFWYIVFQKKVVPILERDWPRFEKYKIMVQQGEHNWDFIRTEPYNIRVGMMNAFMKSEVYKDLKACICGHLKQVPRAERIQTRVNMIHK